MDSLFEYRNCPNCGQDDFEVLFEANMETDDFNVLFDYGMEGGEEGYLLPGGKYLRHVKCNNCHLVYVNPIEKVDRLTWYYSTATNTSAPTIRESYLRTAKSQVELIKKYRKDTSILDIGCAQGFFLFEASKAGYITKGVELSRDAARYAKEEFGLDVEIGPFEELQFPENHFDVVTLWQVLEHLSYPLVVLKEVNRILKPGGLLIVSTPNMAGIPAKILRKKWWDIKRLHINQFTTKTLMDILHSAGFQNISSTSYNGFVSLSILFTMALKYLKVYERAKALFNPDFILSKIMNRIMVPYSSRADHCVVSGFK
jgi:2-polyprenyl-3-methyl-5-hydroxy-6-metoxy-1,4-benzoquinol methylase